MKEIKMPVNTDYQILSTGDSKFGKRTVYMTYLEKDDEDKLDNNRRIRIRRGDKNFNIEPKDVLCYGEVNFANGSSDMAIISNFTFILDKKEHGEFMYSDYNYDTHTCVKRDGHKGLMWYETWNAAKVAKYHHAALGKPSNIVMFIVNGLG